MLWFRCRCGGEPGSIEVLSGVALSCKDAKSSTCGRKLRSAGAKGEAVIGRAQLEACQARTRRGSRATRRIAQQQTVTAEVLKVINPSTFLKSVLQTLVESAARPCDADKSNVTRQIDGVFYRAESYGFSRKILPLLSIACAGMCRLASASSIAVVAMSVAGPRGVARQERRASCQ
jgi:hypothetical protein